MLRAAVASVFYSIARFCGKAHRQQRTALAALLNLIVRCAFERRTDITITVVVVVRIVFLGPWSVPIRIAGLVGLAQRTRPLENTGLNASPANKWWKKYTP